jgi:hypothetical protein
MNAIRLKKQTGIKAFSNGPCGQLRVQVQTVPQLQHRGAGGGAVTRDHGSLRCPPPGSNFSGLRDEGKKIGVSPVGWEGWRWKEEIFSVGYSKGGSSGAEGGLAQPSPASWLGYPPSSAPCSAQHLTPPAPSQGLS